MKDGLQYFSWPQPSFDSKKLNLTSEAISRSSEAVSECVIKWIKSAFAMIMVSKMGKNKPQWPQNKLDLRGWYGGCWGWGQKMTRFWSKCLNFIMAAFWWPHFVQFKDAWPQITWILRHFISEAMEAVWSNFSENESLGHKFPLLRIPKSNGFWLQYHFIMKNC